MNDWRYQKMGRTVFETVDEICLFFVRCLINEKVDFLIFHLCRSLPSPELLAKSKMEIIF